MQHFDISPGGTAIRFDAIGESASPLQEVVRSGAERVAELNTGGRTGRRRAMVIAQSRSSRAFIAEALNAFEPGFDVVTAADTVRAAEWTVGFVPDLIVVDSHDSGAAAFIEDATSRSSSEPCRVIWIGRPPSSDSEPSKLRATVQPDVRLSELLRMIRLVWDD